MAGQLSYTERCMVRMICALALLFVGFAHKPPALEGHPFPVGEFAQYVLPDGTLPILCLPSEDGKGKHHSGDTGTGCEACRLSASIVFPAPADMVGHPMPEPVAIAASRYAEAFYRQLFPPDTYPRGPPAGLAA